jgi:hypothetical protein
LSCAMPRSTDARPEPPPISAPSSAVACMRQISQQQISRRNSSPVI